MLTPRPAAALLAATILLAACSAAAPSGATPGGSPSPSPSVVPSASPAGPAAALIRADLSQAIGPTETFAWLPVVLVTSDGRLFSQGPVPAIYPGPLLPNVLERSIDAAGRAAIVQAAKDAGLLAGQDLDPGPGVSIDLTGGGGMPGAVIGHLRLTVDGVEYDIAGDPSRLVRCGATRCASPAPGTPEAFAAVWSQLVAPDEWLGASLGPQAPFDADAYGILTGPPPQDTSGIAGSLETWPLATPLVALGQPLRGDPTRRCGVVTGADAAALRPLVERASQLTAWTDPAVEGSRYGLSVRPMLPTDGDPCVTLTQG